MTTAPINLTLPASANASRIARAAMAALCRRLGWREADIDALAGAIDHCLGQLLESGATNNITARFDVSATAIEVRLNADPSVNIAAEMRQSLTAATHGVDKLSADADGNLMIIKRIS